MSPDAFEAWWSGEIEIMRRRIRLAAMAAPRADERQGPPYINRSVFRLPGGMSDDARLARRRAQSLRVAAAMRARNGA